MADEPTAFRTPEETPTIVVNDQASRALQLTPGTVLGERYRMVSLIGHGGMGEVYRADDLKLGQTVALKFLSRHGDAQRLHEEVRIGRQISHPNVCRLYDIAEVDGHLFITMEFVDGEDLASLLRRVGRLSSEKALAVSRDICAGVAAAHEKGVIHRDLKPANVMIDGRGRGRVTDFGLALAGGAASDGAGTPAYMAPEQLAGGPASVKSDIYALGLLLYEVFTGRRTFDATSTLDLLARQQRGDFTRPSLVTKDIPPLVERAIVRCLAADPASRPSSVEEMMRELPGFDPLAAAIAAGETPSPAMVAAASERGELSRGAASMLLLTSIVALLTYAALTPRTMLYRQLPVIKSPEVLAERVKEILDATKQPLIRADSAVYGDTDTDQLAWKGQRPLIDLSPMRFYFRQSSGPMIAKDFEHRVMENDPPRIVPGMADVTLDAAGWLREFVIVPPQVDRGARRSEPVDWTPFLQFAGAGTALIPATPAWTAPVDSDEKRAWTIGGDGTRVEAAAFHGKPVWFAVIPPWRRPLQTEAKSPQLIINFTSASIAVFILLMTAYIVASILLAIRNLNRGQGDRRGAATIAIFLFATCWIALALRAHHPPRLFMEWVMLMNIAFFCAFVALATWLSYVGTEPLIRRRWPRMLIGWSRALEGRFRDPMVGRDLLIGTAVGMIAVVAWQMSALAPGASPFNAAPSTFAELRQIGFFALNSIAFGVIGALIAATMLLALHVLTRNFRLSLFIYCILCSVLFAGDATGPLWSRWLFALIVVVAALATFVRFGLLPLAVAGMPLFFLRTVPLTLDTSAWYFGRSLFCLLLVAAMAFYGFVVSLGGKRLLPEITVEG